MTVSEIAPRSGVAFRLREGQTLRVIDPQGVQVSDLLAYNAADVREAISNGRTFDYEETIALTTGNHLWSSRSRPMLAIVDDKVGRHDFLLTPCSEATFRHFYPDQPVHRGCFGNLGIRRILTRLKLQPGRSSIAYSSRSKRKPIPKCSLR